jgi:hypothetical protein
MDIQAGRAVGGFGMVFIVGGQNAHCGLTSFQVERSSCRAVKLCTAGTIPGQSNCPAREIQNNVPLTSLIKKIPLQGYDTILRGKITIAIFRKEPMPAYRTKLPNHFDLPRRINRLSELSYNLWWVWNPMAQRLFNRIDNNLWERVNHNPIRWLREIARPVLNAAAQDPMYLERYDRVFADFDAYLSRKDTWFGTAYPKQQNQIAYFSMEFGLHETMPIYSGGLGVLSGDHLKETSDIGLPLVGVGLLYTEGYFSQRISEDGWQEAINNPLDFANLPLFPVLK